MGMNAQHTSPTTITGSERQVAWATTIREDILARADGLRAAAGALAGEPEWAASVPAFLTALDAIAAEVADAREARWLIDRRHLLTATNAVSHRAPVADRIAVLHLGLHIEAEERRAARQGR